MQRRNFIFLTSGGIAALAIPTWYFNFGPFRRDRILAKPELLSCIWEDQTIEEAGKTYLQNHPGENTNLKLTDLISANTSSYTIGLKDELNQNIIEDYKNNRIIMLEGWLLSVTEARQCALFSLTYTN